VRPATRARRDLRRRARWPAALALAAGLQLALFALLNIRDGDAPFAAPDATAPAVVTLASADILKRPPAPAAAAAPPTSPSRAFAPIAPLPPPAAGASPSPPPPPGPAPSGGAAPGPDSAALATALRHGDVGCANAAAAWMSDRDRERCRDRLAMNAAQVPHLESMAPEKFAYYAAVAKAQEDWASGRDPGHLPAVFCGMHPGHGRANVEPGPPHALRIGPCYIVPPKGSLDVDVDVPGVGDSRPYSTNTAPFTEPIPNAIHQR
jgi:hypothetical protein